jgi:hypothetical protein
MLIVYIFTFYLILQYTFTRSKITQKITSESQALLVYRGSKNSVWISCIPLNYSSLASQVGFSFAPSRTILLLLLFHSLSETSSSADIIHYYFLWVFTWHYAWSFLYLPCWFFMNPSASLDYELLESKYLVLFIFRSLASNIVHGT